MAGKTLLFYTLAAALEIGGCFAFWAWLRLNRSAWWLLPGIAALIAFAWMLTRIEMGFAGRAYAAYGGIYIACALVWLWAVEHMKPDRWDCLGAAICIAGSVVIVLGPRS